MVSIRRAYRAFWEEEPSATPAHVEIYKEHRRPLLPLILAALGIAAVGITIIGFSLAAEDLLHSRHASTLAEEMKEEAFWVHLGGEVGYAFLIAAAVSFFIEITARREQSRVLTEAIKAIGNSVFEGVYKVNHEESYVKAVMSTCLAVGYIRRDYNITCNVYDFTENERTDYDIMPGSLLKVVADVSYSVVNIGNVHRNFQGRYFIPRRGGKLGDISKATRIEIGNDTYEGDALSAFEIKEGDEGYDASERGFIFTIPSKPLVPVRVRIIAEFPKEMSDSEVFAYLLPTIRSQIRFIFHVPGLTIGATARTASDMPAIDLVQGQFGEWRTAGPVLPNDHVTVWWRTALDDGVSKPGVVQVPNSSSIGESGTQSGPLRTHLSEEAHEPAETAGTSTPARGLQRVRNWFKRE